MERPSKKRLCEIRETTAQAGPHPYYPDSEFAELFAEIDALRQELANAKDKAYGEGFLIGADNAWEQIDATMKGVETERDSLAAALRQSHAFIRRCWDGARGVISEPDGHDIQDWLEELGFLKKVVATEPCGENCFCASWDEFPQDCYRLAGAEAVLSDPKE